MENQENILENSHVRRNILLPFIKETKEQGDGMAVIIGNSCDAFQKLLEQHYAKVVTVATLAELQELGQKDEISFAVCVYPDMDKETQYTLLNTSLAMLEDNGALLWAVPNSYSVLHFAAGAKDVKNGWNIREVKKFMCNNQSAETNQSAIRSKLYYPYPNALFTTDLFSDEFLPVAGNLSYADLDFDKNEWVSFDMQAELNQILQDGMFPEFSESYLMVFQKESVA